MRQAEDRPGRLIASLPGDLTHETGVLHDGLEIPLKAQCQVLIGQPHFYAGELAAKTLPGQSFWQGSPDDSRRISQFFVSDAPDIDGR